MTRLWLRKREQRVRRPRIKVQRASRPPPGLDAATAGGLPRRRRLVEVGSFDELRHLSAVRVEATFEGRVRPVFDRRACPARDRHEDGHGDAAGGCDNDPPGKPASATWVREQRAHSSACLLIACGRRVAGCVQAAAVATTITSQMFSSPSLASTPARSQRRRRRALAVGERIYRRWGRLAVFVTPTWVSGALRMPRRTFLVWNAFAAIASTCIATLGAYGTGTAVLGQLSARRGATDRHYRG